MLRVIAIGLLLLYYWYICKFESTPVSQPTTPAPQSLPSPPVYSLEAVDSLFAFYVDDSLQWEGVIPDGYKIDDDRFMVQDACHDQPDGQQILATGLDLYKHLRLDDTSLTTANTFEPHASFPMQQGHVFYFTCQNGTINRVDMCPPGHIFRQEGGCRPIDLCTGKKQGVLLPNVYDYTTYYECMPEAVLQTCPDHHYFLHDSCHSTQNVVDYCRFNDDPHILNAVTVVRCHQKTPVFETCPPGTMLFGTTQCQSTACVGKPNGTRLPMPLHQEGPFQYSPGYLECQNERVSDVSHPCPATWDPYFSEGDNLTHLPQVFDGHACAVPSMRTNVTSDDPDLIVPVHEFTKHVRNWKHSEAFDAVTGYRSKKREAVPAGMRINKKFKLESACDDDGTTEKVMVSGKPNQYFDCTTQTVETCPHTNQFFDGDACRDRTSFAHTYNDVDLFAFNGLSHDGWISPFSYERVTTTQKTCTGNESELLSIYNVCSHPECTLYPFLAQVDFSIKLPNQHECVYDGDTIVKRPTKATFHYASQRERMAEEEDDPCIVGNKVRSGHFVIDSSLYMTCDAQQPFVFCPSPHTTGIEQVNGNRYACVLDNRMTGRLPANKRIKFQRNELEAAIPLVPNTSVRVNNGAWEPLDGVTITREAMYLESNKMVDLEYHTRQSYPPDIAFTKDGVSKSFPGQAFYLPTQKHTAKQMTLPKHDIVACVKDFS